MFCPFFLLYSFTINIYVKIFSKIHTNMPHVYNIQTNALIFDKKLHENTTASAVSTQNTQDHTYNLKIYRKFDLKN